ncbi:LpqB family beta-propeller domain-containing protein [Streptomyces europaeiscabiei]|uniref:LpqB family beta-propeller domain-containing protein n=1 Tax=Streptomyces europaeiscabiei TaxID=146819 RepID=UPI0029B720DF|nr:LpqB family beta-propeller domain-containing protein [Streptomyces europaeiscabiei]MDX3588135.1 LpqB family beta-propeller domain-containing protein [Streptomyces europaeiscabiei]
MGADRAKRGRRRPVRATARIGSLGISAVLLVGCASMPDSGDMRDVESTPRQDSKVRVFALAPGDDAEPQEIVQGFLEALTSDDLEYETARKYLTGKALKEWDPGESTTVLAEAPTTPYTPVTGEGPDTDEYRYELSGKNVARVDGQHAYRPTSGDYRKTVHLTRVKDTKQWRIDRLPQGVVLGRSDFERNYKSINKYYFTSAAQSGEPGTVADPVYVRSQVDPVTQVVRDLLKGPTRWLNPVARTSFPSGTALKKGTRALTPDDQNKLVVPLNKKADRVSDSRCEEMAAQLLFTLQDYMPTGVEEVELQGSTGAQLCVFREGQTDVVAAHGSGKSAAYEYFIDGDHKLVRLSERDSVTTPTAVPGALGEGEKQLRAAAVSRGEDRAAGVSADGSDLYVTPLTAGGTLGDPVVHSTGATAKDRLTTPSWDGRGDLWVADRDPKNPRLLVLADGMGEPLEVRTPNLDGRIEAVRVAADGVRVALILESKGKRALYIGRIERDADAEGTTVSIVELRSVTQDLEDVTAMSWAGDSQLVVVGREHGGVQQMRYVRVDGSPMPGSGPSALTGVEEIAASEDESQPLVAHSADGIVRLSPGAQWQTVVKEGSAPVYPG